MLRSVCVEILSYSIESIYEQGLSSVMEMFFNIFLLSAIIISKHFLHIFG